MNTRSNVCILGSTGSIGENTLDVVARHPDRYRVFALAANTRVERLKQQCEQFSPEYAVLYDEAAAAKLDQELSGTDITVLSGQSGLEFVAAHENTDCVMAAIVGGVGLAPTFAAVRAGKKVLLANKEALVMAGSLFMEAASEAGSTVLPIDSEHNAMFQCLPVNGAARFENTAGQGFSKIVLTGSGGPFLSTPVEMLQDVTPEQACAHPNWKMGRKISVDSATMLNKTLELIEACFLFGLEESAIEIMIHPQSIIHSMVYYRDGSVLAQLGNPDMRTPIAYGLAWPERIQSGVTELDLISTGKLDFLAPDLQRFPCLALGREAARVRGSAPIILNAANELAVGAFLSGALRFNQIPDIIDAALQHQPVVSISALEQVLEEDRGARDLAARLIGRMSI